MSDEQLVAAMGGGADLPPEKRLANLASALTQFYGARPPVVWQLGPQGQTVVHPPTLNHPLNASDVRWAWWRAGGAVGDVNRLAPLVAANEIARLMPQVPAAQLAGPMGAGVDPRDFMGVFHATEAAAREYAASLGSPIAGQNADSRAYMGAMMRLYFSGLPMPLGQPMQAVNEAMFNFDVELRRRQKFAEAQFE